MLPVVHSCRKTEVFRLVFLCTGPAAFAALQQGGDRSGAEEITGFFFFSGTAHPPFLKDTSAARAKTAAPEPKQPRLPQGRAAAGADFPAGFYTAAAGGRGYGTAPGLGTTSPSPAQGITIPHPLVVPPAPKIPHLLLQVLKDAPEKLSFPMFYLCFEITESLLLI